jgi:hypothetical protein
MDETQQVLDQNPIASIPPIATYPTSQPALKNKTPWKLISLIVTLLVVASYFGYQTYQLKKQITVQQPTPIESPRAINDQPVPKQSPTQITKQILVKRNTEFSGETSTSYSFKYPSDWVYSEMPLPSKDSGIITNCTNYTITNEQYQAKLEIIPECSNWSAGYLAIPKNSVVVSSRDNVGDDGHTSYLIRMNESSKYTYDLVDVSPGSTINLQTDKRDVGMMLVSKGTPFVFNAVLTNPNNNEQVLAISDQIITDFLKQ